MRGPGRRGDLSNRRVERDRGPLSVPKLLSAEDVVVKGHVGQKAPVVSAWSRPKLPSPSSKPMVNCPTSPSVVSPNSGQPGLGRRDGRPHPREDGQPCRSSHTLHALLAVEFVVVGGSCRENKPQFARHDSVEGQQNPIGGQEDGLALRDRVATAIRSGEDLSDAAFDALALAAFRLQFAANPLYGRWCRHIGWTAERVARLERVSEIPCLPVEAFKWGDVHTAGTEEEGVDPVCFRTSGTTSDTNRRGVHTVRTPDLYRLSAR